MLSDNVIKCNRTAFSFILSKFNSVNRPPIPEGYELRRMDFNLAEKYREEIDRHYKYLWTSSKEFVDNGFGYCLLFEDKFVSVCSTMFKSTEFAAIDIMTDAQFRRQGLAIITCSAFIDQCIKNNIKPVWECQTGHVASSQLATKLGFEIRKDFPIYWWHKNRDVQISYLSQFAE